MSIINEFKNKVLFTINKYFLAIILFILSTIGIMMMIREGYYNLSLNDYEIRLTLTLLYGGILSIVIREIIDRIGDKNKIFELLYLIVPGIMIIIYFLLFKNISIDSTFLKFFILCILTALLYIVIPFLGKKEDNDYYSYKVINSLIITGISYLIVMFGIIFITYSISSLFEIHIKKYLILQVLIFILGFLMPTIFLSGIPKNKLERNNYPNFIKKILMYIILPILMIYTIILYAYFIKILIELNWPLNVLGNLVIAYSIMSILFLYFSNNFEEEKSIFYKIKKVFPYLLIIPIIMMLISFILRIKDYGITELRYFALMLFIFVIISIVIFKLKNKVKYLPLFLSILLFISTFGPLSAFNVSKISQENRLKRILIDNNILQNNKIVINNNLNNETKNEIIDIIKYLKYNYDLKDVEYLPENFDIEDTFGF